ncbi:MAG TPA: hypothetical protein VFP57_03305, partial [Sphingomicrobium sp.]|nr:hypothetical protein [Sphingomicrobium sp.]
MLTFILMMAATPTATPAAAPAAGQQATAKVECRMIAEPGSRIPTRICRLDKEWELLAKDAQDDLQRSANQRTNP